MGAKSNLIPYNASSHCTHKDTIGKLILTIWANNTLFVGTINTTGFQLPSKPPIKIKDTMPS